MEILNIIRIVIEIIMFIIICTASIYFVLYLKKLNSGLNDIKANVNNLGNDIKPILSDISILTGKFNSISDSVMRISGNAENISGKILDKTQDAELYVDSVRDAAVTKIKNIINMVHSINSGFRTFFRKIN